jgi:hypothetical protein
MGIGYISNGIEPCFLYSDWDSGLPIMVNDAAAKTGGAEDKKAREIAFGRPAMHQ